MSNIPETRVIPFNPPYRVSRCGRVFKDEKEMKLFPNKAGYLCVGLTIAGRKKKHFVHRLVAYTWIPNSNPDRVQINHKDFDPSNNHVDNLEWVTPQENMRHAREGNRIPYSYELDHHNSIFSFEDVLDIFNDTRGVEEIAIDRNVSVSAIQSIKNGKTYSGVTGKKYTGQGCKRLTLKDEKDIQESDLTVSELCEKYNVTRQTIWRVKKKADKYYRKSSKNKLDPKTLKDIKSMPVRDAMVKYGYSQSQIYRLKSS